MQEIHLKDCIECKEVKPFSEFYPREDSRDGMRKECKSCTRKQLDGIDKRNPELYRLANRLRSLRYLYKKQGVEGDFTLDQVIAIWEGQDRKCYYCPDQVALGGISLDHKIPVEDGGTSHFFNLAVACLPCNKRKGNMSETKFRGTFTANSNG